MTDGRGTGSIPHARALELAAAALDFALPEEHQVLLDEHLAGCAACAHTARALAADASSLRHLTTEGVPSARPLLALLAAAERPRKARLGRWLVPAAALAAASIVAVGAIAGGALLAIRPPLGFEPPAVAWSRVVGAADLAPGSPLTTVRAISAFPFATTTLVAAGSAGSAPGIWTSLDEHTWVRVADRDLDRGRIEALAAAGRRIVAVGSSVDADGAPVGRIWESGDGLAWTSTTLREVRSLAAVAAAPGLVVAAGTPATAGAAAVWTSDGSDWQSADPAPFRSATVTGVTVGGPGFVAVGYDDLGGVVWISPDGRDWSRVATAPGFARSRLAGIAATPAGLAAVGWSTDAAERVRPAAWWSADGASWVQGGAPADVVGRLQSVAATPYGIVAVGGSSSGPLGWASGDGAVWTGLTDLPGAGAPDALDLVALGVHGEHVVAAGTDRSGASLWIGVEP